MLTFIKTFETYLHAERWTALRKSGGDRNRYVILRRGQYGVFDVYMVN
jgi:hypothetical protein